MLKKCTLLWRKAHFVVKSVRHCRSRTTFGRSDVVSRGGRRGLCTLLTLSKTWGFCSSFKTDGRCGTFEEDLQICILRRQAPHKRHVHQRCSRSWRRFPQTGCILDQVFRLAKVIDGDCAWQVQHFVWPGLTFCGRHSTLDRWNGKISALHSTFHFWRKSRRIDSFLMLSTRKSEEVSQNSFVFDVAKFKNWEEVSQNFYLFDVVRFKKYWGSLVE